MSAEAESSKFDSQTEQLNFDIVFGSSSRGRTAMERARTSHKLFVRSQDSFASFHQGANGLTMSAQKALEVYGFNILLEAVTQGSAILVCSEDEPSRSIRLRREQLQLTQQQLAENAGVSDAIVIAAEDPVFTSSIHQLQKICEALGLDVYEIGFLPFEKLTIREPK